MNLDTTPLPWMAQAACIGKTADLFYPERHDAVEVKYAVAICQACPVRQECLAHAIATGEDHGVWGGLTPGQRWDHAHGQAPRRQGRPPTMRPIVHGTAAGYQAHYRRGTDPCQPCRDAHSESTRRSAGKKTTTAERIAAIPHGTPRGYHAHHRLDTPPCRACRDAWNADKRNRRRNQKKAA